MTKNIVIGVLVIITLLLGYQLIGSKVVGLTSGPQHMQAESFLQGLAAGVRDQFIITNTGGVKVGTSGTTVTRINTGTCYIKAYATTIAATSTASVDCQATAAVSASGISALTGVTSGDVVSVNLATSTAGTTFGGLILAGASASTTDGYITLRLTNLTGTTYTWPVTGTASGTATYIVTDI